MAGPAPSPHIMQQQSHMKNCTPMIGGNSVGRHPPPAYNVAAQRALLHRLGRAHSHEGVTLSYCPPNALISMTGADMSNELDVDDNGECLRAKIRIRCFKNRIKQNHSLVCFMFIADDDGAQVSAV